MTFKIKNNPILSFLKDIKFLKIIKKKIFFFIYKIRLLLIKSFNKFFFVNKINLGGGKNFNEFGWLNYDSNSLLNVLHFSEHINIPHKDETIKLVYTSHTLEHLSDEVVNRILFETKRILVKGGIFIVIIPDYDFILKKWTERDQNFFGKTEELGFHKNLHFWKNKNIEDNLDNRAAFLFCSYWNLEFKKKFEIFQSNVKNYYVPKAFWGPPNYDQKRLQYILKENSPKKIADNLISSVLEKNDYYFFCNQKSWSKRQFIDLVEKYNLTPVESNKEIIKHNKNYKLIRGFLDHYNLSNYFIFKK